MQPPLAAGLVRARLQDRLAAGRDRRLRILVAPAGSGKTTLLAQAVADEPAAVAWYRAEAGDADEDDLVAHLQQGLAGSTGDAPATWGSVAELADELHGREVVFVIDDLHHLRGSRAETALGLLLGYLPRSARVIVATRRLPNFDLSRLRLDGDLVEVGPDDLRFRSWEVEQLFRNHYGEPLPPEDVAELARRTGGWAAGLQLFHLATTGQPYLERRRALSSLPYGPRLVREYLARNVLDGIEPALRRFVVHTCVLGVLSGELCDALLGATGSQQRLQELASRQLFTVPLGAGDLYRYHEALRGYLEDALVAEVGEAEVRSRFLRAARLLEERGRNVEALHCYSRAEAWPDAGRLLGRQGEQVAEAAGGWVEALPRALVSGDPWLLLVQARTHVAAGRWGAALDAYREAERAFGTAAGAGTCRLERAEVAAWLDPQARATSRAARAARAATRREPSEAARAAVKVGGVGGALAAAWAALLAGDVHAAAVTARGVLDDALAEPALVAAARLAGALARFLAGDRDVRGEVIKAAEVFDRLEMGWCARMARTALALFDARGVAEAAELRGACERDGDVLGAPLAALCEGFGRLMSTSPDPAPFEAAVAGFRRLGAATLEAWSQAGLAVALSRGDDPSAHQAAVAAEALARACGVHGARSLAYLALATTDPARSGYLDAARSLAADLGLALGLGPLVPDDEEPPTQEPLPPFRGDNAVAAVTLRCFGGFRLLLEQREADASSLKPRARAALLMLAMRAPLALHREALIDALWPDDDLVGGVRKLQVVVSTLRGLLRPTDGTATGVAILRQGETYRLELPDGADIDVVRFEAAMAAARAAHGRGDDAGREAALRSALAAYGGDLLPEVGPAEWVVDERERYRVLAASAAYDLSRQLYDDGDLDGARSFCERGVTIDRFHDGLWSLLISICERAGAPASAARVKQEYADVLALLDVDVGVRSGR